MIWSINISTTGLARKLTAGLVASDRDAVDALDVILELLVRLFETDGGRAGDSLVMDAALNRDCWCADEGRLLLEHLWVTLLNWTMRVAETDASGRIYDCLSALAGFYANRFNGASFLAACQPWLCLALVAGVRSRSENALQLANHIVQQADRELKPYGIYSRVSI